MIDRLEKDLLHKITEGDTEAFQVLIEQYQRLVAHIVFRMVMNSADRQDLCQDIFLKIYENLNQFQFHSKLSTWIARIAYHLCLNYLKKKKVPLFEDQFPSTMTMDSLAAESSAPDQALQSLDLYDRMSVEIQKIPVQYRTILTLYHLDEMSYAEIAKVMDLPEGTVKNYLFRARRFLKHNLLLKYQKEELYA
jgi:RNA polymerase sigma factor (sigma-70 family)